MTQFHSDPGINSFLDRHQKAPRTDMHNIKTIITRPLMVSHAIHSICFLLGLFILTEGLFGQEVNKPKSPDGTNANTSTAESTDARADELKYLAGLPPIMPINNSINLLADENRDLLYTWLKDTKYDDPRKVFTFEQGILKISGDGLGGIITKRNYANYHLICEFRFTGPTFHERKDRARDSGILVHGIGPDGGYDGIWPASIEAPQIIEGGMGDVIVVPGKFPDGTPLPVAVSAEVTNDRDGEPVWKKGGEKRRFEKGRINWSRRDPDWEDKLGFRGKNDFDGKLGEWTRLECICENDRIINICNGVIVNELFEVTPTSGRIILQSELAALEVRRWELWPIGSAPTSLRSLSEAQTLTGNAIEPVGLVATLANKQPKVVKSAGFGDSTLKAGGHAIDISPTRFPVAVNGGIVNTMATELMDPLYARCLVLDDSAIQIVFMAVDACVLDHELVNRVKAAASQQTGIPAAHMMISATHTHSAPSSMSIHGSERDEHYTQFLEARLVEGIVAASQKLVPAKVGWGSAPCEKYAFCRHWFMKNGRASNELFTGKDSNLVQMNPGFQNPDAIMPAAPVDVELTVLYLTTLDDAPLGVLANYSTHYAGAPAVSADYFGEFCRRIEKHLEDKKPASNFLAMMTNGTSGDANTRNFAAPSPLTKDHHIEVATETARIVNNIIRSITPEPKATLGAVTSQLEIPVRLPNPEELAEATQYVAANVPGLPKSFRDNYARETVLLSKMPATRHVLLQSLRVGPFAITAAPNELFGLTGLTIKRESPFPQTMNIGLANGFHGYIPPREHHRLGGYTSWRARSSCLEVDAEEKIRTELLKLLRDLASDLPKRSAE